MFHHQGRLLIEEVDAPRREGHGFCENTGTLVMVGRVVDFVGAPDAMLMLYDRLAAQCEARDAELRVAPAADLSHFELDFGGLHRMSVRIGVGIGIGCGSVDDGISTPFQLAAVRRAEERARGILDHGFWHEVGRGLDPITAGAVLSARNEVWGVPFGPLSSGGVGYGVPRAAEEVVPEGLARMTGRDFELRPFPSAVHGVPVGWGTDWTPFRLDLSDAAHAKRTERAPVGAAYHVVPRFG